MFQINSIEDYIESIDILPIGETFDLSLGTYGIVPMRVVATDYDCPGSATLMSVSSIGKYKLNDTLPLVGGYRKSSIQSILSDIWRNVPSNLKKYIPNINKEYNTTLGETSMLMRVYLPSVDELTSENCFEYFKENSLETGYPFWTRTIKDYYRAYSIDQLGRLDLNSPTDELDVLFCMTLLKENVKRVNYISVEYPDTITGDSDIIDCIRFDESLDKIHKVYYPIMFCV